MSFTIHNEMLLELLFEMEEKPTLRNRYKFWQRVGKLLKASNQELDASKLWNYQVNVVSGEITIHEIKETAS